MFVRRILSVAVAVGVFATFAPVVMAQKDAPKMAGGKMESKGDKKSPPRDAKGRFMKKGGPMGDHRMAGGKMESKGDKKSPPRDAKGRFMKKQ